LVGDGCKVHRGVEDDGGLGQEEAVH
jgi:hypothetical protein